MRTNVNIVTLKGIRRCGREPVRISQRVCLRSALGAVVQYLHPVRCGLLLIA